MTNENSQQVLVNTFQDKKDYEAFKNLIETRSDNAKPLKKLKDSTNVWDREPVDFTWKLYHPHPPKRNARESMKPWTYDKYLRPTNPDENEENNDKNKKKSVEQQIVEDFFNKTNNSNTEEKEEEDFQVSFRVPTPQAARIKASRTMSFREGLGQYKNPAPHDFRGLKSLYGAPDFATRFEKDPYNILFLSSNLNKINGLARDLNLRDVDEGLQMGDLVKKKEPQYDPNLILPKLPFPTKNNAYSRYRQRDRSVESAFWDRVLPKLNSKWSSEKSIMPS